MNFMDEVIIKRSFLAKKKKLFKKLVLLWGGIVQSLEVVGFEL